MIERDDDDDGDDDDAAAAVDDDDVRSPYLVTCCCLCRNHLGLEIFDRCSRRLSSRERECRSRLWWFCDRAFASFSSRARCLC